MHDFHEIEYLMLIIKSNFQRINNSNSQFYYACTSYKGDSSSRVCPINLLKIYENLLCGMLFNFLSRNPK